MSHRSNAHYNYVPDIYRDEEADEANNIWKEVSERKAVVIVHPTHPVDNNLIRRLLPRPIIDYPFETTRAAVDFIASRTVRDFPDVKIIFSRGDKALTYLISRLATVLPYLSKDFNPKDVLKDARSFYYDTTISGSENILLVVTIRSRLTPFCRT
ncbi:hypothetical protein VE01_04451 [Pseudogymnoascus verrucosus]|uniref:Uncharacterized protein n=1 Tax=Pseudogymnoascus verrucosus TaxID=342668 RepID=A0A1B8GP01_9PEZI|nr:uncharacterized protein VE01_04451 [Pseudogymnoascus verrucosus]OBT97557.1 hypothetical protein VE01_04451 [Pseudogymnoascus verrucosus]